MVKIDQANDGYSTKPYFQRVVDEEKNVTLIDPIVTNGKDEKSDGDILGSSSMLTSKCIGQNDFSIDMSDSVNSRTDFCCNFKNNNNSPEYWW